MDAYWQLLIPNLLNNGIDPDAVMRQTRLGAIAPGDRIILAEADPKRFLPVFFAAMMQGAHIWLAHPQWDGARWEELLKVVNPHWIFREGEAVACKQNPEWNRPRILKEWRSEHLIFIPSGGSSGELKFAAHNWGTLSASAWAFLRSVNTTVHNAFITLPLFHVSGLMAVVRTVLSGGEMRFGHHKNLPEKVRPQTFLSLVPSQLEQLIRSDEAEWKPLKAFECILVGGAPLSEKTAATARSLQLRIAPCYGMTETAALVTLQTPEDFSAGHSGVGRPLSHAHIEVVNDQGKPCADGVEGRIVIRCDSLALALFPEDNRALIDPAFLTSDLGFFDATGSLNLVGRVDRIINTGGEKVNPSLVERHILRFEGVKDVRVFSMPHDVWGRMVCADVLLNSSADAAFETRLESFLKTNLAPHEIPKLWNRVHSIPRSEVGKIKI
jgi:O-succinylbenzoic acid--CoA ligase